LPLRGQTPRKSCAFASCASHGLWRDILVPTERLEVPCRRGLHHATYQRLVDEYNRALEELKALPNRALWPHLRKAYEHQFLNRIVLYSTSARIADAGTAGQALVPGKRCRALPGCLHKIRPALDSDGLPALRARWRSGALILRPRGAAPRTAPTEDMNLCRIYLPNRCVWNQVGSILGKCLDYLP
jgi:hypothetical protein